MATPLPDFYAVLGVPATASAAQITQAYRKESLKTHPDRFPNASPPQREAYTARFQSVADAYHVLSDQARRAEYDAQRRAQPADTWAEFARYFGPTGDAQREQAASSSFFSARSSEKSGSGASSRASSRASSSAPDDHTRGAHPAGAGRSQPSATGVFGDVFSEILRPEVSRIAPWWTWVGSASGAALGFIVANVPGAVAGAVAGNRLGAVRDAKGKSVAEVFADLSAGQRTEILRHLVVKLLGPQPEAYHTT